MMSADQASPIASSSSPSSFWYPVFAGLCASLVGIGLARFAYTPLIPPLIQAHWFAAAAVVYLGAANLAGYLVGALLGRPIAARLSNRHTLRLMMLLVCASFLACAFPVSVSWFFGWRFLSGVAGGSIMVLVAATLLPHIAPARRGMASGAIFFGLGLGIAASGTLVPLLLNLGLRATWIGLGILALLLTAASWSGWPMAAAAPGQPPAGTAGRAAPSVAILYLQYALMAVGLVPTMVFLVDFIARGLGAGAHLASLFWIVYGVGAIAGPLSYGWLGDRLGPRDGMRLVLLVQVLALAGIYLSSNYVLIGALTIIIGSFPPGIVPLMLARMHGMLPHDVAAQNRGWSRITVIFAASQALVGYAYSAIFNASGGNYRLLFLIAAVGLALALLSEMALAFLRSKTQRHG
ncbi:YbfB/YjiJ family MFS transporter [Janthinobacterium agaricidamnosum]|uniref:Major Facilitator Superfamily protein n=1 Tax=Janthinobacterium agaricidamnosum NBRC 102515 = DSM 9628 TaxID=1349767 RepID=W0VCE6_9BURK|nr:YbfB/YjiJ family MFS transporter [Janthinobacterium agaricidamnosum]CDG85340.1 major Facilitator Superfamily protein [Janthinobacterium agaricidamnosum NBRC 102515 = DSM 9628]